jgi:hypothetical protein
MVDFAGRFLEGCQLGFVNVFEDSLMRLCVRVSLLAMKTKPLCVSQIVIPKLLQHPNSNIREEALSLLLHDQCLMLDYKTLNG